MTLFYYYLLCHIRFLSKWASYFFGSLLLYNEVNYMLTKNLRYEILIPYFAIILLVMVCIYFLCDGFFKIYHFFRPDQYVLLKEEIISFSIWCTGYKITVKRCIYGILIGDQHRFAYERKIKKHVPA